MPARLEITDGTDTVSLIRDGTCAFFLNDWTPRIAQAKGGGVYQQSALADGRRLVDRYLDSVAESFNISGKATSGPDGMAMELQVLRSLVEKAVEYWTTDWQSTPVYFICQAECETNERYGLIMNWSTPTDENPFSQPWLQPEGASSIDDWTLTIERDHWTENAPGTGTAVAISAVEAYNDRGFGNVTKTIDAGSPVDTRTPTTANEVYVANKRNEANITHIYVDDGGVFGVNLTGAAVPYDLLPAVPALDDAVYFGINTALSDSGPFCSLVFDLSVAQNDLELVWEYWDGVVVDWINLVVRDHTRTVEPFDTTGVNSVHWVQPDDWATTTVNAITGYWVRARIEAGVGAAPSPPTQQNRDVYSVVWPYVEIQSTEIGGTIPALAQIVSINEADGDPGAPLLAYNRVLMGLRSVSRGADFTPIINAADEQNNANITVTVGANTAFADDVTSPTGRVANYTAGAADPLTARVAIDFTSTDYVAQYYGEYHAYIRAQRIGSSSGDMEVQLVTQAAAGGDTVRSDAVLFNETSRRRLLDMGRVQIPGKKIRQDDLINDFTMWIYASSEDAGRIIRFYDLILLPVDEWASDSEDSEKTSAGQITGTGPEYLDVDAITFPKGAPYVNIRRMTDDAITGMGYIFIKNGMPRFRGNSRLRLYFISALVIPVSGGYIFESLPWNANSVLTWKNQRYFSYRGAS